MKEFVLDWHSGYCQIGGSARTHACEQTNDVVLFFAGNEFYLVRYFHCLNRPSKIEFCQGLIKACFDKWEIFERHDVDRCKVTNDLREYRRTGRALKRHIRQINYCYYAGGKDWAITTQAPYIDALCNEDLMVENYQIAKKELGKRGNYGLLEELDRIFFNNYLGVDDMEVVRTVDCLISKINNNIKQTQNELS